MGIESPDGAIWWEDDLDAHAEIEKERLEEAKMIARKESKRKKDG